MMGHFQMPPSNQQPLVHPSHRGVGDPLKGNKLESIPCIRHFHFYTFSGMSHDQVFPAIQSHPNEQALLYFISKTILSHILMPVYHLSLDFLFFFFLRFSSFVSDLASRRFECCARISSNLDFASLNSASDLEAISC